MAKEQRFVGDIPVPTFEGYALAQQILAEENWEMFELVDYPEVLAKRVLRANILERKLKVFFQWIQKIYSPRLVFYPFSGWHTNPRDTFGEDTVVHLSNDDKHTYLEDIERGLRVKGDIYDLPFKDAVFDAVFIRFPYMKDEKLNTANIFAGYRRVVRPDGLFIVELVDGQKDIVKLCQGALEPLKVPKNVATFMKGSYLLFLNRDKSIEKRWWGKVF